MISRPLLRTILISSPPTVLAAQSSILNSESPRQRNYSSPSPGNNLHIFWIRSQLNPVSLIHIRSAAENVLCLTTNYNLGVPIVVVSLILTFIKRCVKKMVRERKPNGRYFENWVSPHLPLQAPGQLPPWTLSGHLPDSYPSQTPLHSHSF